MYLTSAIIPKAIMKTVRIVRSKFVLIDFRAMDIFSINIASFIRILSMEQ